MRINVEKEQNYIDTKLLTKFGAHIKKIREEKGLSQEKASLLAAINTHYLSDLENGRKNPSLKILYKLSLAYEISLEELFEGL